VGITPGTDSWNIIISQRVMMNSVDSGTREAERAGAELAQERLVLFIFITGICFFTNMQALLVVHGARVVCTGFKEAKAPNFRFQSPSATTASRLPALRI
jgi:hypothetical protein